MTKLYLILFTSAFAFNISKELTTYLNEVFKDTISGADQDLYQLLDIYYQDRQLVNGFTYQAALLFNNTLSHSLSLHYLKAWTDFNSTKLELIEHSSPKFESVQDGETDYITESMMTHLKKNDVNFTSKQLYKQTIQFMPFVHMDRLNDTSPEEVKITLFNAETLVNGRIYNANLVLNSTGNKNHYVWQVAYLETVTEKEKIDRMKLKVTLLITIVLCFILASSLTYLVIYIYYRRKNTIPCVRNTEEKARLAFNMAA